MGAGGGVCVAASTFLGVSAGLVTTGSTLVTTGSTFLGLSAGLATGSATAALGLSAVSLGFGSALVVLEGVRPSRASKSDKSMRDRAKSSTEVVAEEETEDLDSVCTPASLVAAEGGSGAEVGSGAVGGAGLGWGGF